MVRKHSKTKDRRDIGKVVFLSEKMDMAREMSSCCVGTEALLETDKCFDKLLRNLFKNESDNTR